jgi:hypothetical protein
MSLVVVKERNVVRVTDIIYLLAIRRNAFYKLM